MLAAELAREVPTPPAPTPTPEPKPEPPPEPEPPSGPPTLLDQVERHLGSLDAVVLAHWEDSVFFVNSAGKTYEIFAVDPATGSTSVTSVIIDHELGVIACGVGGKQGGSSSSAISETSRRYPRRNQRASACGVSGG